MAGLVKNRKLSRAISDAGWAKFKLVLAAKCDKYGRDLTIVDRWFASSQICSCCGKSGGKKELDVREWECLYCNTVHDRDLNAATNLVNYKDAGGQSESKNGRATPRRFPPHGNARGSKCQTTVVAVCNEPSTTYKQLRLF